MTAKLRGFTLVELSIVLVILGLLVGGVLTGQSLIRAAELRSVTTQYNAIQTSLNAFKDKYFAIPGDMNNAQSFWGVAHATPATCVTTVGTGTQTCNGDGNGVLSHSASSSNEPFRFWQHLANAGLIEGNYRGTTDGSNTYSATLNNVMRGKISSALWYVNNWGTIAGAGWIFDGIYNNYLEYGGSLANNEPGTVIFKPEELWNIDVKIDDGKPATGKLVMRGTFSSCTTTSSSSNLAADYLLSNSGLACIAIFPNAVN